MRFIHSNLGYQERGTVVEITLKGNAATVRLLDSSNFAAYRNGRRHRYVGGLAKRSPVRLATPSSGHWHVAVDMQGLTGRTNASIRVLPRPLPEIRERPLSSVPSLVRDQPTRAFGSGNELGEVFDVFISYASEDKDDIVRPLAQALESRELRVWFDEFELRIGDNLRRKIDAGLVNSRFGVVVLSPNFFYKEWPQYELDGLVTRDMSTDDEQALLPIWHNLTKAELMNHSPSLAAKLARSTATHTIDDIADEIASLVNPA